MCPQYSEFKIKKGQTIFDFKIGLPDLEDYGISALPSWNTTIWVIEKSNKGFKLQFGTPCPKEEEWLYLTIFTPPKFNASNKIIYERRKEPTYKPPKEPRYV